MLILELSRKSGVSRHTIRYYEKLGMIKARDRRENSYKEYGENALYSLVFVDRVKKLGFSLFEIRNFLQLLGRSRKEASDVMEEKMAMKLEELDEKIQTLQQIRGDVSALLNHCRSNPHKGSEGIQEIVHSMQEKAMAIGIEGGTKKKSEAADAIKTRSSTNGKGETRPKRRIDSRTRSGQRSRENLNGSKTTSRSRR